MSAPERGPDAALSGSRSRRLLGFGGVILVAWLVALLMSRVLGTPSGEGAAARATRAGSGQDTASSSSLPSMPPVVVETALPPFGGLVLDEPIPGYALTARDAAAAGGAWTVVVRRDDGSLGHNGAVVTYPVDPTKEGAGSPVQVGSAQGFGRPGFIVWPLAGQSARIRGDLPGSDLVRIAESTTVVGGHPKVAQLPRFTVADPSPARLPLVHEIRYNDGDLGFTYTGMTSGGGFEDALYGVDVTPVGTVHGSPAVASTVQGGNGTVAWEPAPGLVAYVGWSSSPISARTTSIAVRLAEGSHSITAEQWLALTPQLVDRPNILGGQ